LAEISLGSVGSSDEKTECKKTSKYRIRLSQRDLSFLSLVFAFKNKSINILSNSHNYQMGIARAFSNGKSFIGSKSYKD